VGGGVSAHELPQVWSARPTTNQWKYLGFDTRGKTAEGRRAYTDPQVGTERQTGMANPGSVWVLVLVSSAIAACGDSRGAGTPRPETEVGMLCRLQTDLTLSPEAASENEVVMEGDPSEGSVCIANHFRGRVDCPYGQSAADYASYLEGSIAPNDGRLCRVSETTNVVEGAIVPQLFERRASLTVYRSCRCADVDGNRTNESYCECPSNYSCAPFLEDLGFNDPNAGSYCIKNGTVYDPSLTVTACSREKQNCGPAGLSP
jgi:hypothetical protein